MYACGLDMYARGLDMYACGLDMYACGLDMHACGSTYVATYTYVRTLVISRLFYIYTTFLQELVWLSCWAYVARRFSVQSFHNHMFIRRCLH